MCIRDSVIAAIYRPDHYFKRCATLLKRMPYKKDAHHSITAREIKALFASLVRQTFSRYGLHYLRLLGSTLISEPRHFPNAVNLAVKGYHFFKMTDDIMHAERLSEYMRASLERLEEEIFLGRGEDVVRDISNTKQEIINFRKVIRPQRAVLRDLERTKQRYLAEDLEVYFDDMFLPSAGRLLQSWFIDGWFPVFPWVGYAVLGALFFRTLFREHSGVSNRFLLLGASLTALGFALLFVPLSFVRNLADGGILESRGGYSEIFYPPTFAYIFTSVGIVMLFSALLRRTKLFGVITVLGFFGRYSMMVYILHQVIGVLVIEPATAAAGYESIVSGPWFTLVNLAVLGIIYAICYALDRIKRKHPTRSTVLQIVFGK